MRPAPIRERSSRLTRALLACGVLGPPFFIVVFLVAGATRPHYDPLRHPVSSLALTESGWVQVANFVITGALLLAFAVGVWRAWRRYGGGRAVPVLIGLIAIGLIGSGVFPGAAIGGYPPSNPMPPEPTLDSALHDAFGVPVFLGLPIACLVAARHFSRSGRRGWALYSLGTAVLFVTGFVLFALGFSHVSMFIPVAGLLQRLTIIVGWAWLCAFAWFLLYETAMS